jgi:TP53 regulating kinase-like protein
LEKIIRQLSWGAESNLYLINYLGKKAVLKRRLIKPYMHPELAQKIVRDRTVWEARIMYEANLIGVNSPLPLKIIPDKGEIVISYIRGILYKRYLDKKGFDETSQNIVRNLAHLVARLHNHGIIHGDLTTSNIIYQSARKKVYIIDYGLSFKSNRAEDKAMDIRVLERSVESTHPLLSQKLFSLFQQIYFDDIQDADLVRKRLSDIKSRGRYVVTRA